MEDFKALISLITSSVDGFNKNIPSIQKTMLNDVLLLIKNLDIKGDSIRVAGSNLKILTQLQGRLQRILLNPQYINSVKKYAQSYNEVVNIQNDYFKEIESKFKPPKLTAEIKKQAISSVVNQLTENGLNANVVDKVHNIIRQSITTGGSYSTLSNQLKDFLITNKSGDGQLVKYTKQISTDAINQFSGQYSQLISSDLGFEWFRYSGSNIETTRPFCLACTERKYFHISELPKVLRGEFDEFNKYNGKVNKKTNLPEGMYPNTDVSNFMTLRGGYNCQHQWRPCSEDLVPMDIKQSIYNSLEYKQWAKANGKKIPETIQPPKKEQSKKSNNSGEINLDLVKQLKNVYDVNDLLISQKDKIAKWFNNTEFKSLSITRKADTNGSTDMNGNIKLSTEKSRLFAEALNNIKNKIDLDIDHEKAISTFWHEVWHNRNQSASVPRMTDTQIKYMELGNEFVSRNTLDEIFTTFGTKLKNAELRTNRNDTGYNRWVRNYDKLIEYFGISKEKIVTYMTDKMTNGEYTNVKNYLIDAIIKEAKKANEKDVKKGVQDAIIYSETEFAEKYTTQ